MKILVSGGIGEEVAIKSDCIVQVHIKPLPVGEWSVDIMSINDGVGFSTEIVCDDEATAKRAYARLHQYIF